MTRTTKIVALVLTLLAVPAYACMGWLVRTDMLMGGVACTYRLTDGSHVRLIYQGQAYCPPCME